MQMSMFSSEERHVSRSASRDCARDWLTHAETSCSPIWPSLAAIAPAGSLGRMSPASCPVTRGDILEPSSMRWANSGMGSPTECWTLNMCEHADSRTPHPAPVSAAPPSPPSAARHHQPEPPHAQLPVPQAPRRARHRLFPRSRSQSTSSAPSLRRSASSMRSRVSR